MKSKTLKLLGVVFCIFFISTCGGGGGSNSSSPAPNIYVDQTNIDFAGTVLNSSEDRTITIKNTGNANLKINQILLPDLQFKINDDKCSNTTLAPGQSSSITVRFSPTIVGQSSKTLSIPSNDPNASTVNVALKGEGCGLNVQINQVYATTCPYINVDFTVINQEGNLLTDLTAADNFHIFINGSEVASNSTENSDRDPISVVLALDFSSSLNANLPNIQAAAQNFISEYLNEADEAAVCKFKATAGFFPPDSPFFITTDDDGKADLIEYIGASFSVADGTALYDAIYYSAERANLYGNKNKLAIILLSDGANTTDGNYELQEAINYANSIDIPIFSIYYIGIDGQSGIMQQLADDTDGKFYTTEGTYDLEDTFQQIRYVLTDKYSMTFMSTCTGSIEIEVRATTSDGLSSGVDKRTIIFP